MQPLRTGLGSAVWVEGHTGGSAFGDYARLLYRKRVVWVLLLVAGAGLGLFAGLAPAPIYLSRVSVEILPVNESFLNMNEVNLTSSGAASRVDVRTQVKILRSRSLREAAAARTQASPEAARMASDSLTVSPEDDSRVVELSAESTDPAAAAQFLNLLVEELIDQNLESRWKSAQRTEEWLKDQLAALERNLQASEQRLHDYARSSDLVLAAGSEEELTKTALDRLRQALAGARAERFALQSRFELALTRSAETLPEIVREGALEQYQLQLTALRKRRAELATTFTEAHHEVRKVASQIDEIEAAIAAEQRNAIERLRNGYEAAVRRESLLSEEHARELSSAAERSGQSIRFDMLRREVDSNRGLYDDVLRKVKQAAVASALSANNIRVVDPAQAPARPHRPNPVLSCLMGALTGLFAGIVLVLARDRADRTLRGPGDLERHVGLAELGAIPDAGLSGYGPAWGCDPAKLALRGAGDALTRPETLTDAFRAVRASLLLPGGDEEFPKVIVVTSPGPGEGKTTVAGNLALALAEIYPRVVLVDGDTRRPRLHHVFDVDNLGGFRELVRPHPGGPAGGVESYLHCTSAPGLYLLPSGRASAATETLASAAASGLLRRLRESFDAVVIDTPPMLIVPDARVLGRLADGVILVTRAGVTRREAATAAKERLVADRTRLLGAVLNAWDPSCSQYGDYGAYSYDDNGASEGLS